MTVGVGSAAKFWFRRPSTSPWQTLRTRGFLRSHRRLPSLPRLQMPLQHLPPASQWVWTGHFQAGIVAERWTLWRRWSCRSETQHFHYPNFLKPHLQYQLKWKNLPSNVQKMHVSLKHGGTSWKKAMILWSLTTDLTTRTFSFIFAHVPYV